MELTLYRDGGVSAGGDVAVGVATVVGVVVERHSGRSRPRAVLQSFSSCFFSFLER